jgi:hypothetical protein
MNAVASPHVQRVLDAFDNVRATATGWTARCPHHQDRKNSLSIGVGDDAQVLIHCHVGCETGMVLYRKGLTFKDLYPPRAVPAPQNGHGRRQPTSPEPPSGPTNDEPLKPPARVIGTTRYELLGASGELVRVHMREDLDDGTKRMWYEMPDGRRTLDGMPKAQLPLYGVHAVGKAPTVFVCEGEKAAEALRSIGVAAVGTATGADTCPCDDSLRPLLGRNVVLWPDRDQVGDKHMDGIGVGLHALGQPASKLFRLDWPDAPPKGDAADFVARGGTRESLNGLLATTQHWQPRPATADQSTAAAGSSTIATPSVGLSLVREPSQATRLVTLARQGDADLFHDPAGATFITFTSGDHRETWPLSSRAVREWLSRRFFDVEATAPGGQALHDALATLAGFARFDGMCREVFVRLAADDESVYLDLGNDAWQVVRITAAGWDVIAGNDAPVRFRRPRAMLPLPTPEPGGDLSPLRSLLNVANDDAFTLIAGWLLGALNPRGSYPILVLHGEQGSAKTTAGRMLRGLLDPNVSPLRTQPREEGDLLIAASGGLMVAYDNLSHLPDWLSDGLCRLTSGGGLSKRQLYTDIDEIVLDARRPALLTGIESTLSRADALDRAVLVELEQIPKRRRRTEDAVWADYEAARPTVLGALLTAASTALRNLPALHLAELPRLADFARWVEAGAPAFGWQPGAFIKVYDTNRASADELALDASPIGPMLLAFMEECGEWQGTATDLLSALNERATDTAKKERGWPKQAASLSGQLKRIAPNLRRLGIACEIGVRETTGEKRRVTRLRKSDAEVRPQRHQRHSSLNHADSGDDGRVTSASLPVTGASPVQVQDPRNDADFWTKNGASATSDAGDAVSHNSSQHDPFREPAGVAGDDQWTWR